MRAFTRRNIESLEAYEAEPQKAAVVVNANENPYNLPEEIREEIADAIKQLDFNRYPDPTAEALRHEIARFCQTVPERIVCGNGLDEVLMLLTQSFISPNDTVVSHAPSFSMYEIWTRIADGQFIHVDDLEDFTIDIDQLIETANHYTAKIVFVCSPNNPTGYQVPKDEIIRLIQETNALIVLDEAYVDFADSSLVDLTKQYERLIVLRTMSKAMRMPAARVGWAIADPRVIEAMRKVKGPYNLNTLSQTAAKIVLSHSDEILEKTKEIARERDALYDFLKAYPSIHVYPSSANFLYFTTKDAPELQQSFLDHGVLVKYYRNKDAFRISIGTPQENGVIRKAIVSLYGESDA